jgi:DNA-binding XRE family transcriptional regulator
LRAWRDAAGVSQRDLSARARVAQSVISDIEADKLLPNVAIALRLARALGVTVEQITWRDDTLHHRPKPEA